MDTNLFAAGFQLFSTSDPSKDWCVEEDRVSVVYKRPISPSSGSEYRLAYIFYMYISHVKNTFWHSEKNNLNFGESTLTIKQTLRFVVCVEVIGCMFA